MGLEFPGGEGAADLALLAPDGSDLQMLTDSNVRDVRYESPMWSPDGTRIVYDLEDALGSFIYLLDPAGGPPRKIDVGPSGGKEPVISPDGTRVAFRQNNDGLDAIYVADMSGGQPTQLTTPPGDSRFGDAGPDFSPDGSQIVFVRNGALEIMNGDGTELREILPPETLAWRPRWSPDGTQIVFGTEVDMGEPDTVRVVNADGTGLATLVGGLDDGSSPSWSPDGHWIVFTHWRVNGQPPNLLAMWPDGSHRKLIWQSDDIGRFPFEATWRATP